jgi:cation-transporting P-type ATPase E
MELKGLTEEQVKKRISEGKVNRTQTKIGDTLPKIILRNILTIFNLVNLILALMIISVGAYKNLLFILVAIANTLISIINSIRAKKTVDKMRLTAEQKPTVIRDGKPRQILANEIVDGDLLIFKLGDQIIVDSKIEQGNVEVNEAFVTGEQDNIQKGKGDTLTSGSFVVSGTCQATATSVGANNFINKLESDARIIKTADSKLFSLINNIVKYISFALIPIGIFLLLARFRVPDTTPEVAVTSTVAGLISMIPEGLVLLTSSVLALATIRLSRQKVLVQDLYSIETLARVDTICLDKTGTLTTGKMTVKDLIPAEPHTKNALENALKLILGAQDVDNATSSALKEKLLKKAKFKPTEPILEVIPFSSDRKYSGVRTSSATYLMGAPEFLTDEKPNFPGNYRIMAVVKSEQYSCSRSIFGDGPNTERLSPVTTGARERSENKCIAHDQLLGYVLLEDELRKDAKNIIDFFKNNDVTVKIISGDNLNTVTTIAEKVGLENLKPIDLSTCKTPINYTNLVKTYNIFTRVKPAQKKSLVGALKKQGRTVAMTGDGVNDILAMKEADCSIAIGEGFDAARRAAKLVLLNSDFAGVPNVIAEGRQSINNLERSATLFLSKNTYAAILALIFIIIPLEYPFAPLEMSLLNFACIGLPGVILALEKNTARVKNRFITNILQYSVPTGLTVAVSMLALSVIASVNDFSRPELITSSALITFAIDFLLILWISKPLNLLRRLLLLAIFGIIALALLVPLFRNFLDFTLLAPDKFLIVAILIIASYTIFFLIRRLSAHFTTKFIKSHPKIAI